MKRFAFLGLLVSSFLVASNAEAVDVVWDGGDGNWEAANWNTGQTPLALLGTNRGIDIGDPANPSGVPVGTDVFINGGNVNFDADILDDFRWVNNDQQVPNSGTLTITGGASLNIDSAPPGDSDGHWSQFNTKALNIDNGTLRRTFTPTDPNFPASTILSGGVFSFAGTAAYDNIDTQVNLTNGGTIDNDGILSFGWYTQSYANVKVAITINSGHLDLTGGDNFDFLSSAAGGDGNPDLLFHRGWDDGASAPIGEDYSINFTGPGSIKVDHSGILIVNKIGPGGFDYDFGSIQTLVTYEEVWDAGILQANGLSGLDDENFSDFFTVTGTSGSDGYILTSLLTADLAGDFDGDTDVDGSDFLKWQRDGLSSDDLNDWTTNFGAPNTLSAAINAVPEPTTLLLLLTSSLACLVARKKRN